MITLTETAKNAIEQNTSVTYGTQLIFEYNMNSLVDNVTVSGADISKTDSSGATYTPFKKLFPVDSIIKPFRPQGAGVKYAISGDVDSGYKKPGALTYTPNFRIYYPGVDTTYKYYVSNINTGLDVTVTYPKTIITNKIVARFELSHSTPATWSIFGNGSVLASGTNADIIPFTTSGVKNYNAGTVTIYYNGTSWVKTEPSTISAPINLTSVKITTGAVASKYTGLIELSPKWVVDATEHLVSFDIAKESSTSSEDLMPVGKISANSVSLSLISFETARKVISFDKTLAFDSSKIYLYKQMEIKPYIKVYNSGGALSDSKGTYDNILQGTFYADSWSFSEYGEISLTGLDGAKVLQETIAPKIMCENFSATGIIRRMLDAIGFTNYNINIKSTDASIITPTYWWTENNQTVWDSLQELCRDTQMTAVFSAKNVLEFYSRDYIFDSARTSNWDFRSETSGSNLSNILSFEKNDLASANQIKVFWNSVLTSNLIQSAQAPWESDTYFLSAFSLNQSVASNQAAGTYLILSPSVINEEELGTTAYNYTGYFAIDSEIIEYDAVQFEYEDSNGTKQFVDLTSKTDNNKYIGLAKQGTFKPSGKYRIKTRGAFGTTVEAHNATAQDIVNSWSGYEVVWT
jgi:hypothetical protein